MEGFNSLEINKIHELSQHLAFIAGSYILENVSKVNEKMYKDNTDGNKEVVTKIDLDIHEKLYGIISKNYPDHEVLSEEDINSNNIDYKKPIWIIDPLDGTTNFSNGLPIFGSSISFVFNYQTEVSALFIPSIEKMGGKCISWSKSNGILVDSCNFLFKENSNISFVPGYLYSNTKLIKKYNKLNFLSKDFRNLGSISYEGAMVILGNGKSLLCNNPKIWDVSALIGIFSDQNKSIYINKTGKNNKK
ncbi:MAG TPA: inositol monophosphatase family protein, partial [Dehalococcoidia bacterium]|nr:inositol monophosphatase family protein [Dehalococcoidia bacterium]